MCLRNQTGDIGAFDNATIRGPTSRSIIDISKRRHIRTGSSTFQPLISAIMSHLYPLPSYGSRSTRSGLELAIDSSGESRSPAETSSYPWLSHESNIGMTATEDKRATEPKVDCRWQGHKGLEGAGMIGYPTARCVEVRVDLVLRLHRSVKRDDLHAPHLSSIALCSHGHG